MIFSREKSQGFQNFQSLPNGFGDFQVFFLGIEIFFFPISLLETACRWLILLFYIFFPLRTSFPLFFFFFFLVPAFPPVLLCLLLNNSYLILGKKTKVTSIYFSSKFQHLLLNFLTSPKWLAYYSPS